MNAKKFIDKKSNHFKNSLSLPYINSTSKKFISKPYLKRDLIHSSIKEQKYKLDVKKYQSTLLTKKRILSSLKKECEQIKIRDKSTDKLVNPTLKLDPNEISMNNGYNNDFKSSQSDTQIKDNRVKNYKESKKNLEKSRKKYNKMNDENNRIKFEIDVINNEIRNIENKIDERSNDLRNIKTRIEFAEKNNNEMKQILDDNKEKNKKLSYIKDLEQQKNANINKLNETNKTIASNEIEINELKNKLKELMKNK